MINWYLIPTNEFRNISDINFFNFYILESSIDILLKKQEYR